MLKILKESNLKKYEDDWPRRIYKYSYGTSCLGCKPDFCFRVLEMYVKNGKSLSNFLQAYKQLQNQVSVYRSCGFCIPGTNAVQLPGFCLAQSGTNYSKPPLAVSELGLQTRSMPSLVSRGSSLDFQRRRTCSL